MKLVAAIVQKEDAGGLIDALTRKGFRATRINTAGGFLKSTNATVLVGVDDDKVQDVLRAIEASCRSRTHSISSIPTNVEVSQFCMTTQIDVEVGGATVFVLSVEQYVRQ